MDYDYDMKMERVRSSVYKDDGNMQKFSRYSLYNDFTNVNISCIHLQNIIFILL